MKSMFLKSDQGGVRYERKIYRCFLLCRIHSDIGFCVHSSNYQWIGGESDGIR